MMFQRSIAQLGHSRLSEEPLGWVDEALAWVDEALAWIDEALEKLRVFRVLALDASLRLLFLDI
jgi:hypothetical protein